MAKKGKSKTKQDDEVVYDDTDEDEDDWVEDEKAAAESDKGKGKARDKPAEEKPVESVTQMPENKPGEAPPKPEKQEPPPPNSDISPNQSFNEQAGTAKEE